MPHPNDITPAPINSTCFNRTGANLTAFASDIASLEACINAGGYTPWLRPIYKDAADVGMAIISNRTGACVRFYLDRTEIVDGDLKAWHFAPVRPVEACGITTVTIFND